MSSLQRIASIVFAFAALCFATPAYAQIIFTIVPRAAANGEYPTGLHVMGGYSAWQFGYTPETTIDPTLHTSSSRICALRATIS